MGIFSRRNKPYINANANASNSDLKDSLVPYPGKPIPAGNDNNTNDTSSLLKNVNANAADSSAINSAHSNIHNNNHHTNNNSKIFPDSSPRLSALNTFNDTFSDNASSFANATPNVAGVVSSGASRSRSNSNSRTIQALKKKTSKMSLASLNYDNSSSSSINVVNSHNGGLHSQGSSTAGTAGVGPAIRKTQSKLHNLVALGSNNDSHDDNVVDENLANITKSSTTVNTNADNRSLGSHGSSNLLGFTTPPTTANSNTNSNHNNSDIGNGNGINRIRQLNFGFLGNNNTANINNNNSNSSGHNLHNLTSNNSSASEHNQSSGSVSQLSKRRVQRKVSVNELSHLRSNSLALDKTTIAVSHEVPLSNDITGSDVSASDISVSTGNTNTNSSANANGNVLNTSQQLHNLVNKKSFTFFNKFIKPSKGKSKQQQQHTKQHQQSYHSPAERYAINKNANIIQTKFNIDESLNGSDLNLSASGDDAVHERNPSNLAVNTDGRLSTMTEDSFYFKSKTPTTPIYSTANNNNHNHGNSNLINGSSNNSKDKPLPEIGQRSNSNVLDIPVITSSKSLSPASSINKGLPEIPAEEKQNMEGNNTIAASVNSSTINDEKCLGKKSKLLPPIGNELNINSRSVNEIAYKSNSVGNSNSNNHIGNNSINSATNNPYSEESSMVSPRALRRSPTGSSSRLSKIISKISFNGMTTPRNRQSLISLRNQGSASASATGSGPGSVASGSAKRSALSTPLFGDGEGNESFNDTDQNITSTKKNGSNLDNLANNEFTFINDNGHNSSSAMATPKAAISGGGRSSLDQPQEVPQLEMQLLLTPQRNHGDNRDDDESAIRSATVTLNANNIYSNNYDSGLISSVASDAQSSSNLPTPTIGLTEASSIKQQEFSPQDQQRQQPSSLANIHSPRSPASNQVPPPLVNDIHSLEGSNTGRKSLFRSPSKRLSKRLSGKFSGSPLMSLYKSASPKRYSSPPQISGGSIDNNLMSAMDDTNSEQQLTAISVPELQHSTVATTTTAKAKTAPAILKPSVSSASDNELDSVNTNESSLNDAEIVEAPALVTAKKFSVSPVRVSLSSGHSRKGSTEANINNTNINDKDLSQQQQQQESAHSHSHSHPLSLSLLQPEEFSSYNQNLPYQNAKTKTTSASPSGTPNEALGSELLQKLNINNIGLDEFDDDGDYSDGAHNYSQLSPIEEIDSPESAHGKIQLSARQREMPSITSSLNKFATGSNSGSNSHVGNNSNFPTVTDESLDSIYFPPSDGLNEKALSPSETSFHTTETSLPSPAAALFESGETASASAATIGASNSDLHIKDERHQATNSSRQILPLPSPRISESRYKDKSRSNEKLPLDDTRSITPYTDSDKIKPQKLLTSEESEEFLNSASLPVMPVAFANNKRSSSLSRLGKTLSILSESVTPDWLENGNTSNATGSGSSLSKVIHKEQNKSDTSIDNVVARPRKAKSPRSNITSYQEDFLTRSAKTLSTISANRKTLRPISAAFKTPMLPDYEDDLEETPILPSNGKNSSQITLNFDEKPLDEFDAGSGSVSVSATGTNNLEGPVHEHETPLSANEEQSGKESVAKDNPTELNVILEKEGFNEFMSPKFVDINYEKYMHSNQSSPSSEFEFATANDYHKKEGKKLDFGITSTPIEMSKDPIFANISRNNSTNKGTHWNNNISSNNKSPAKSVESNDFNDIIVAPSQPRFPAPVPSGYHHPTIAEESEPDTGSQQSPKSEVLSVHSSNNVIFGVAGLAKNVHGINKTSDSANPFLEDNSYNSNAGYHEKTDNVKSAISLPKKPSQLSLNKMLYSNNNIGSTVSDFDNTTVHISNSNSNRTLTKGFYTPSTSPFRPEKAGLVRRPSQLKNSNSLRLVTTPRGKATPGRNNTNLNDYSVRSPESVSSNNSNNNSAQHSITGSPRAKTNRSNSNTESIYQEVYGNLKLREEFKSDISLNTMKKSSSVSSLDIKGRHGSRHYSSNLHTDSFINLNFEENDEANELALLFVKALHSFDSSSLNSEDTAICLSFEKDDIAFVYNIDESGWGEVVLLSNLSKGWVPMNYFKPAVDESADPKTPAEQAESRKFLKPLFIAAAEFLLNPQDVPVGEDDLYTFSTKHMNDVRDGVKLLLQYTDCLSRTAPVVHKRPVIRKVRKALLADWYTLMSKADKYKGTTNEAKVDFLKALTYKVLIKALAFLDIWGNETESYEKEKEKEKIERRNKRHSRRRSKQEKVLYLDKVPFATERLLEVKDLLFSYLSLIMGRLDIIENNYSGCEQLESVIHQVILLLRELLFIGKSATILLSSSNHSLDSSLDNLLAYVSDLVTSVKHLVSKAEIEDDDSDYEPSIKDEEYYYSKEGTKLIRVVAQMIVSISKAMYNCQYLLRLTKDFQLNIYRKYPDFGKMKILPSEFIKKSVSGLTENQIFTLKLSRYSGVVDKRKSGDSFRYSHIRGGSKNRLSITPDGTRLLKEYIGSKSDPIESVTPITNEEYDSEYSVDKIMKEVVYDDNKNILGASFKALVFLLANERSSPSSFFIATFFMNFRNFASTKDLIHELIKRFDIGDREKDFLMRNHALRLNEVAAYDSRLKKRRKTIITIIRIWLESYWSYEKDFQSLPTLMNFLNEGAANYLLEEVQITLELCARLAINHPSKKKVEKFNTEYLQLISRRIGLPRKDSATLEAPVSTESLSASNSENDLSSLSSNSSVSSLVSLNLPLNFSNYHISAIMNKNQVSTVEKSVLTFRNTIGEHWPSAADEKLLKQFQPIELSKLINAWFNACAKKLSVDPPAVSTEISNLNAVDLAKQLTDIESTIFLSIQSEELLDENFREKRIHLQKSPNIERSVLFTNLLSDFVIDTILSPGLSMRNRVANVKQWLKIATACYQLKNYNSLAAIMTILQSSAISRLEKLWSGFSSKYIETFEFLVKIINPNKNYKVYRNIIKPYLVSDERKASIAIVPYINLFLQDIIFANDGNPSKRIATIDGQEKTLVNFDKYVKIVNTISELEFFQVSYPDGNDGSGSASNSLTSPISKASVFSFSPTINNNNNDSLDVIVPNPALEEFLLFKLWATNQYNLADNDRFWKYSIEIQPQSNN